jgi:energy-converting hydrogenase Eha subunit G
MQKDDQNFWNIMYSLFFIVVAVLMIRSLYITNGHLPTSIPLFDLGLLILATFRLTRLFVYDKITHFLRDMFQHVEEVYTQEGITYYAKTPRTGGPLRTAYELLICPWCFSIWAALFVTYAYFLRTQLFWLPILILAISGLASAVQVFVNMIGWIAENKKLDANERNHA